MIKGIFNYNGKSVSINIKLDTQDIYTQLENNKENILSKDDLESLVHVRDEEFIKYVSVA